MSNEMKVTDLECGSYEDAKRLLGDREKRKVAHNTYVIRLGGGNIAFRLYEKRIVVWKPDETCTLYAKWFKTATTKKRLNALCLLGISIYQVQGLWYIAPYSYPFQDGCILEEGTIPLFHDSGLPIRGKKEVDDINLYVKAYVDHLSRGLIQPPDIEDCETCARYSCTLANPDHLTIAHLGPHIFSPSLLNIAVKEIGGLSSETVEAVQLKLRTSNAIPRPGLHNFSLGRAPPFLSKKQIATCLGKYLKKCFDLPY